MGCPLSPVIAEFEWKRLGTATIKPPIWIRYVDNVFIIWCNGPTDLDEFLQHSNSINHKVWSTVEIEMDNKLSLLDTFIEKDQNKTLGRTVYREG